jgi:hypothetical protein
MRQTRSYMPTRPDKRGPIALQGPAHILGPVRRAEINPRLRGRLQVDLADGREGIHSDGTHGLDESTHRPVRNTRQISDVARGRRSPAQPRSPCAMRAPSGAFSLPRPRFARSRLLPAFSQPLQIKFWNAWDVGWPTRGSYRATRANRDNCFATAGAPVSCCAGRSADSQVGAAWSVQSIQPVASAIAQVGIPLLLAISAAAMLA